MSEPTPTPRPRLVRRLLRAAAWTVLLMAAAVAGGGIVGLMGVRPWFGVVVVVAGALVFRPRLKMASLVAASLWAVLLIWLALLRPSHDREWWADTAVLPEISVDGDRVTIRGLRNFTWRSLDDFDARWETRTYDLDTLDRLELMVEPLSGSDLMAHTMLGFGFGADERIIISAEARKEVGEDYGVIPALLRQFELLYVIGDEEDLLTLRAVGRGARIMVFPVRADRDFIRSLFLDMCREANRLREEPAFYRMLSRNCTTSLVPHVDKFWSSRMGWNEGTLFPARAGRMLHTRGLLDTDLPYEEAAEHHRVDERVRQHAGEEDFSRLIRGGRPGFRSTPPG